MTGCFCPHGLLRFRIVTGWVCCHGLPILVVLDLDHVIWHQATESQRLDSWHSFHVQTLKEYVLVFNFKPLKILSSRHNILLLELSMQDFDMNTSASFI